MASCFAADQEKLFASTGLKGHIGGSSIHFSSFLHNQNSDFFVSQLWLKEAKQRNRYLEFSWFWKPREMQCHITVQYCICLLVLLNI